MTNLLLLTLCCSLFCFGLNYATLYIKNGLIKPNPKQREVLWFVSYYGDKYLPTYLTKPLYGCLMCMASVYGNLFYWSYVLSTDQIINSKTFILCVVVVTMTSGLNRIFKGLAQL